MGYNVQGYVAARGLDGGAFLVSCEDEAAVVSMIERAKGPVLIQTIERTGPREGPPVLWLYRSGGEGPVRAAPRPCEDKREAMHGLYAALVREFPDHSNSLDALTEALMDAGPNDPIMDPKSGVTAWFLEVVA